jgi:hypothetical protein
VDISGHPPFPKWLSFRAENNGSLSQYPIATLTTVLNSCDNETFGWSQPYHSDLNINAIYQTLGTSTTIVDFHLQEDYYVILAIFVFLQVSMRSSLHLGGKRLWCGKDCGRTAKVLLLAEASTRCQRVYQIMHLLCHF